MRLHDWRTRTARAGALGLVVSLVGAAAMVMAAAPAAAAQSQTITYSSSVPAGAVVGQTYAVIANASSALPVALTIEALSTSDCSISAHGVVTFLAAGTCVIDANQAGDSTYAAAPQVQQSVGVGVAGTPQSISITSSVPADPIVGGSYTPVATATSGLPVSLTVDATAAAVCSLSGGTVTLTANGTCVIDADQAGNSTFAPAPQVQQSVGVGVAGTPQTITITSTAPAGATIGQTYTPTATATSGLPVSFSVDASAALICSIAHGVVTVDANGSCVIDANQPGDSTYAPALQVQQTVGVGPIDPPQTITFTSSVSANGAAIGGTYTPAATATSGLPVTFTIDSGAALVCSLAAGVVTFDANGNCVIDADQSGGTAHNLLYAAAPQVQQSVAVGAETLGPQSARAVFGIEAADLGLTAPSVPGAGGVVLTGGSLTISYVPSPSGTGTDKTVTVVGEASLGSLSATVLMSLRDDGGTPIPVFGVQFDQPSGTSLASLLPGVPTSGLLAALVLPAIDVTSSAAALSLPSADLTTQESSFFAAVYGTLPATISVPAGVNLSAGVPLNLLGSDLPQLFGYQSGQSVVLAGTLGTGFVLSGLGQSGATPFGLSLSATLPAALSPPELLSGLVTNLGQTTLTVGYGSGTISASLDASATLSIAGSSVLTTLSASASADTSGASVSLEAAIPNWVNPFGITWIASASADLSLTATYAGGSPSFDASVTATVTLQSATGPPLPFTLSADLNVANTASLTVTASATASDTLADLVGVFPYLGPLGTDLASSPALQAVSVGPINATVVVSATPSIEVAASASITMPGSTTPVTASLLVEASTSSFTFGLEAGGLSLADLLPPNTLNGADQIILPHVGIVLTDAQTPIAASALTPDEYNFFKVLYGCPSDGTLVSCTDFTSLQVGSGLTFIASMDLPLAVDQEAAKLGIALPAPGSGTVFTVDGTVPLFGGTTSLSLTASLNNITIPDTPDWFPSGSVTLGISTSGIEISGAMVLTIPRALAPPGAACDNGGVDVAFGSTTYCSDKLSFSVQLAVTFGTNGDPSIQVSGVFDDLNGTGAADTTYWYPFGIPGVGVHRLALSVSVAIAEGEPTIGLGIQGDIQVGIGPGAIDVAGAIEIGLTVIEAPPFVLPNLLGISASSASGVSLDDLVSMANSLTGSNITPQQLSGLPNVGLENLNFQFSQVQSTALCLTPGLQFSADLYVNTSISPGPSPPVPSYSDPNGCRQLSTPPGPSHDCIAHQADGCVASVFGSADESGLTAQGELNAFSLGLVSFGTSELDLTLTAAAQHLTLFGSASVTTTNNYVIASGFANLTFGLDGLHFVSQASLLNGAINGYVAADAPFGLDVLTDPNFSFQIWLSGNVFEGIDSLIANILTQVKPLVLDVNGIVQSMDNNGGIPDFSTVQQLADDTLSLAGIPSNSPGTQVLNAIFNTVGTVQGAIKRAGYQPNLNWILNGLPIPTVYLPTIPGVVSYGDGGLGNCSFWNLWAFAYPQYSYCGNLTAAINSPGVCNFPAQWYSEPGPTVYVAAYYYITGPFGFPFLVSSTYPGAIYHPAYSYVSTVQQCWLVPPGTVFLSGFTIPGVCQDVNFFSPGAIPPGDCTWSGLLSLFVLQPALNVVDQFTGLHLSAGNPTQDIDNLVTYFSQPSTLFSLNCAEFSASGSDLTDLSQGSLNVTAAIDVTILGHEVGGGLQLNLGNLGADPTAMVQQLFNELFNPQAFSCPPEPTATLLSSPTVLPPPPTETLTGSLGASSVSENSPVTFTGTFGTAQSQYPAVTVDWGDGTIDTLPAGTARTVTDSHTYTTPGPVGSSSTQYEVIGGVSDPGNATVELPLQVNDVPPSITSLTVAAPSISEGSSASLSGTFTEPIGTDADTVTIDWGDGSGQQSLGLTAGASTFAATHQYVVDLPADASYPITVTVADQHQGSATASTSELVTASPPTNITLTPSSVIANQPGGGSGPPMAYEGVLTQYTLSFVDLASFDSTQVSVAWGDGSADTNLSLPPGTTTTLVTHAYADEGTDRAQVSVQNQYNQTVAGPDGTPVTTTVADGIPGTAAVTIPVADAALLAGPPVSIAGTKGVPFTTMVGSFIDQNPGATTADYTALISWGDGHSSPGTVSGPTGGPFTVSSTHTYAEEDPYAFSVAVSDHGSTVNLPGSATVTVPTTTVLSSAITATSVNFIATVAQADQGGNVTFYASFNGQSPTVISGCASVALTSTMPYAATCPVTSLPPGDNEVSASFPYQHYELASAGALTVAQTISGLCATGSGSTKKGNLTLTGGAVTGTVNGNVTINGNVSAIGKVTIDGNVTVNSGSFTMSCGTVDGNLQAQAGALVIGPGPTTLEGNVSNNGGTSLIVYGATVTGNLSAQQLGGPGSVVTVCTTHGQHNLQVQQDATTGAVTIGGPAGSVCGPDTVDGNLQLQQNASPQISASYDTVGGNLQVQNNVVASGPIQVEYDTVSGNLQVQSNGWSHPAVTTPVVAVGADTVGGNLQCSGDIGPATDVVGGVASPSTALGHKQGECQLF